MAYLRSLVFLIIIIIMLSVVDCAVIANKTTATVNNSSSVGSSSSSSGSIGKRICDQLLAAINNDTHGGAAASMMTTTTGMVINYDAVYKNCCLSELQEQQQHQQQQTNYTRIEECVYSALPSRQPSLLHFDNYQIIIHNYTPDRWTLESTQVEWGTWHNIPDVIGPWEIKIANYHTGYFSGFEGSIRYSSESPETKFPCYIYVNHYYFSNNGMGTLTIDSSNANVKNWWTIKYNAPTSDYHVWFRLPERETYSIVISSDPQPWRLDNDGDPNNQQDVWESFTERVFQQIKSEYADFIIINGDMTEFGDPIQLKSIKNKLNILNTAALWGLGNHDYANNVNDCASDIDFSKNSCAESMIKALIKDVHNVYIPMLNNFRSDESSLAYAWTYGKNIRYAQLNYYPLYDVTLEFWDRASRHVTTSLAWLKSDMTKHKDKMYILNMHMYDEASLEELKDYFDQIALIFVGHTHIAAVECHKGRKIYNTGALFKGDYFTLEITKYSTVTIKYKKDNHQKILYSNILKKWTEDSCSYTEYL